MNNLSSVGQYQRIDVESRVAMATPHNLISMLLDGALKKVAVAGGALQRGDVNARGVSISAAIGIIDSLRAALDHDRGGDLAGNLEALYSYMEKRLAEANRKAAPEILAEVSALLNDIRAGWDTIPAALRGQ
jgi:flagellar protein FliS